MALMIRGLYEALLSAGVAEDKAAGAAEAVAIYENRLTSLEGKVTILMWAVGLHVAVTFAGFGLVLSLLWQVLQRLPRG